MAPKMNDVRIDILTVISCKFRYTDLQISPGRTPLWSAVQDVYNFMKEKGRADVRHILVITDSPDTCHPDSPDYKPSYRLYRSATKTYSKVEQPSCSTVSYDDFLNTVLADIKDPSGNYLPMEGVAGTSLYTCSRWPIPNETSDGRNGVSPGGHYLFQTEETSPTTTQTQMGFVLPLTMRLRDMGRWVNMTVAG